MLFSFSRISPGSFSLSLSFLLFLSTLLFPFCSLFALSLCLSYQPLPPFLFVCRHVSSVYLTTLSRTLPVARFTRGPDFVFYLFSTTTLWSPLVSRVLWSTISVSLSRVVPSGGLCFPGVLSIDYGTTIDLPDSAGDRRWERHIGIQREKMVD